MKTNQPWSRRSLPLPRARSRPWIEITWAVPVLPATSRPASLARPAVPAPFTAIHRPSWIADTVAGFSVTASGGRVTSVGSCHRRRSAVARISRGTTRAPLATEAIITAIDIGVTDTWPWPIATEMVSPAYQLSP